MKLPNHKLRGHVQFDPPPPPIHVGRTVVKAWAHHPSQQEDRGDGDGDGDEAAFETSAGAIMGVVERLPAVIPAGESGRRRARAPPLVSVSHPPASVVLGGTRELLKVEPAQ